MNGISLRTTLEGASIAIDAIRANRVRAALTILGVAVGVFVVVIISAAIHGINAGVAKDIESAGPSSFFVQRYPLVIEACDDTGETCKWRNNPPISEQEVAALSKLSGIQAASAIISTRTAVKYRTVTLSGPTIEGRSENWPEVSGGGILPGRNFTRAENEVAERVIIINDKMAKELFGASDPLGKNITVGEGQFRVIGIYNDTSSFLTGSDGAKGIVPIETARRHLDASPFFMSVVMKPTPTMDRDLAIDNSVVRLREIRGLKPTSEDNFAIITQDQLFNTYNKIFGVFFLVMIVLSAIGLLVGGVGVVAIMIISVTERTREIGVRKALGATPRVILWQFLVEAVTLTGVGAMVGLIFGWLAAMFIRLVSPVPAAVPPGAIFAALLASAVTGVLFGIFPALRAARMDPVEALRHE